MRLKSEGVWEEKGAKHARNDIYAVMKRYLSGEFWTSTGGVARDARGGTTFLGCQLNNC